VASHAGRDIRVPEVCGCPWDERPEALKGGTLADLGVTLHHSVHGADHRPDCLLSSFPLLLNSPIGFGAC